MLAAADSIRVTVYGRGGHGSMPYACIDPVVLAATIVIRLQTIVSREVAPTETVVLTVGDIPKALGAPSTYWGFGGIDADTFAKAAEAGRISQDIPVNHSPTFGPVIQPTLDTGTEALVVAALAWL